MDLPPQSLCRGCSNCWNARPSLPWMNLRKPPLGKAGIFHPSPAYVKAKATSLHAYIAPEEGSAGSDGTTEQPDKMAAVTRTAGATHARRLRRALMTELEPGHLRVLDHEVKSYTSIL